MGATYKEGARASIYTGAAYKEWAQALMNTGATHGVLDAESI